MYKNASLLQHTKAPMDAISPSKLRLGLVDRIRFARGGTTAVAGAAAKLAKSTLTTPWTWGGAGAKAASKQVARAAASNLTRGGSEIASGIAKGLGKLKFW
jgi:hypothetical protein